MTTIVLRSDKNAPLIATEVDANFTNLNTDKAEINSPTFTGIVTAPTFSSTVATGTAPFAVASTTAVTNLSIGGNAATVTTNANLTGMVTSVGNATTLGSFTSAQLLTALTDKTGTGFNVFATSPTLVTPALGTPSALVGTNITGTAANFTATRVTTNANLTGGVTSIGNAATVVTNANLTGGVTSVGNAATVVTNANLTGGVTSIGNAATVVTNANLTGMVTSIGNAATVVTNANLTGGVTSVGNAATVVTNANLTGGVTSVGNAATVVTNANLTGAVTSVGNATSLGGFTSGQLLNALTGVIVGNYTGTGLNVFANNPTLTNPALGTPSALVGTNITGTAANLTAGTCSGNSARADVLNWKNYGGGHVIIDASNGTSPSGSAVNNTNSTIPWSATYPTLMGWNGAQTHGVRVDVARISDSTSGSSASCTGNANTVTSGVYTVGNQTIGGVKTFSSNVLLSDAGFMFVSDGAQDTGISWASDGVMNVKSNNVIVGQFNNTGFTGNASTATTAGTLNGTWTQMPAGTRVPFAQAAAPTGWTQDVTDNAINRMLRVVNTAGGGVGGSSDPILNNVVPNHTHGFSTGTVSSDHSHTDAGHKHYGTIRSVANNGFQGNAANNRLDGGNYSAIGYASLGGITANHSHSGTTDNGSSGTNWTPRYIDMIICSKN